MDSRISSRARCFALFVVLEVVLVVENDFPAQRHRACDSGAKLRGRHVLVDKHAILANGVFRQARGGLWGSGK